MSVADDLERLTALHVAGSLDAAEFRAAKAAAVRGTAGDVVLRAVTEPRRRVSVTFLAVAVVCGVLCLFCLLRASTLRAQASAVQDAALVEALGVAIPDPRPNLERLELRARAAVWSVGAGATAGVGALAVLTWLALRPSRSVRRALAQPDP